MHLESSGTSQHTDAGTSNMQDVIKYTEHTEYIGGKYIEDIGHTQDKYTRVTMY